LKKAEGRRQKAEGLFEEGNQTPLQKEALKSKIMSGACNRKASVGRPEVSCLGKG
jgi:hypothetical protein